MIMEPFLVGQGSQTAISKVPFDTNNNITLKYSHFIIYFLAAW